jgi:hypothetical protein
MPVGNFILIPTPLFNIRSYCNFGEVELYHSRGECYKGARVLSGFIIYKPPVESPPPPQQEQG